jgi:hypothetical protein
MSRTLSNLLLAFSVGILAFSIWVITQNLTLKQEVARLQAQCVAAEHTGQEGR